MSYLRCTHADCLQIHAPAPDTTFGQLLERAEQCGRAPLAIFAGSPRDANVLNASPSRSEPSITPDSEAKA